MTPRFLSDENTHLQIFANVVGEGIKRFRIDGMPEYGHLSLLPLNVRVFDNPLLAHQLCDTACVINETGDVYIYAPFLEMMAKEDAQNAGTPDESTNVVFTMLHELSHQYLGHIHQAGSLLEAGLSMASLNRGADTSINMMLLKYPTIKLGKQFVATFDAEAKKIIKGFYGTTAEEKKIFDNASFVEIAWHYQQIENLEREQKKNGPPQNGQPQSGQPQNGQPQSGQPQSPSTSDGGDFGLDHTKSLKDLVDALKNSGLGHLTKHFGLPDEVTDDVAKALRDRNKNIMERVNGQMEEIMRARKTGDPANDFFSKEYQASKPKQIGLENLGSIIANTIGGEFQHVESEPGLVSLLDSEQTMEMYGVAQMPIVGSYAPVTEEQTVLLIIDSSGSMTYGNRLQDALSSVIGVVETNPAITGVYLAFADDVARRIHFYSSDEISNLKEFKISGFGGTDMAQALVSSIMLARQETNSIKVTILVHDGDDYDLGDRMVEVQNAIVELTGELLPPLVCIIPEGCGATEFMETMKDHAVCLMVSDNNPTMMADIEVATSKRDSHTYKPSM